MYSLTKYTKCLLGCSFTSGLPLTAFITKTQNTPSIISTCSNCFNHASGCLSLMYSFLISPVLSLPHSLDILLLLSTQRHKKFQTSLGQVHLRQTSVSRIDITVFTAAIT